VQKAGYFGEWVRVGTRDGVAKRGRLPDDGSADPCPRTGDASFKEEFTMIHKEPKKPDFSDVTTGHSSTAHEAPPGSSTESTYTVVQGDSLSKIAKRFYDDANEWRRIFEANRDQIENPDLIHPGQVLRIPRA
jgi:nucleoid-associated protein YgaU